MNATVQPTGWLQVQEDLLSQDVTVRNLEKSHKGTRSEGPFKRETERAYLTWYKAQNLQPHVQVLEDGFQLNTRPSRKRRNPTAGADALQTTESAPFRT